MDYFENSDIVKIINKFLQTLKYYNNITKIEKMVFSDSEDIQLRTSQK